jgi:shikimate kinase
VSRPVILVGLSGSGKSTIGRLLAAMPSLSFSGFVDLDAAVERAAGRSVTELFSGSGEPGFRLLERAAMDRALAGTPSLIAAGAGWIAEPGNLAAARARKAVLVYLRVSPRVAALRLAEDRSRPLLAGADRAERLQALLEARESWYLQADIAVDAEAEIETVVLRIAEALRHAR